jgi:predicted GIY-YIG superfamily endonuclease
MEIYIGDGLLSETTVRSGGAGVYMIVFDSGHFYIGSSCQLNWRIRGHIKSLRTKLRRRYTAKSLIKMAGFNGSSIILLIEDCRNASNKGEILSREKYYIRENIENPLCLNIRS